MGFTRQSDAERDTVIRAVEKDFEPVKKGLEAAGFTVKVSAYAGRTDFRAGGHVNVLSTVRQFFSCSFKLHADWKTGKIARITVTASPARAVTLKYSEKSVPGIIARAQAAFDADIAAETKRKQVAVHGEAWVRQAVADMRGVKIPRCVIPGWKRDNATVVDELEALHQGMDRTPVGRYFPKIDEYGLYGAEGLTAAQMRYLSECLNNLPAIT